MKLKSTLICAVFIVVVVSAVMPLQSRTAAQERKITVRLSELPAAIHRAIEKAVAGDKIIVRVEKEVEGEDPGQYDVVIRSGEKRYEVEISPQGKVIEVKEIASADDEDAGLEQIKRWTDSFHIENCTFSTVGINRFFSLEPGHQLVLQSDEEKVVITVLDKTRMIGGIRTRVIEEREEKDGQLAEVSRNFFAICKEHGDVFYFGEEVDDYKDGRIVGHGGAWQADEPDSKAGIIMPGTILLGARHYQEISPKAMDRAEIIADDVTIRTPAGTFKNCIRVEETSGLDPDEKCYKTYAPGVGIIQDEDLLLVRYSKAEQEIVSMADLPRRVRATIRKHTGGAKVTEIVKEAVDGVIRYEAEIIRNGKEVDILVSTKGKYLGIEGEGEAADDDDEQTDEDDDSEQQSMTYMSSLSI